jgi:hypothetical protein
MSGMRMNGRPRLSQREPFCERARLPALAIKVAARYFEIDTNVRLLMEQWVLDQLHVFARKTYERDTSRSLLATIGQQTDNKIRQPAGKLAAVFSVSFTRGTSLVLGDAVEVLALGISFDFPSVPSLG